MDKEQLLPELPKPEFDVCELSYTAQVYTAEQMKEYALAAVSRVSAEGMQEQPEGYVLVPKSALDWLNGEHPDGFEPPADQKLFRGKIPPYWWRSEFRRRIAAAPPAVQETAQTEPTAPNQGASIEVQIFAIEVEKILCSALGRPWSTAGISIETLIAELAARSARVPECGEFGAEQLSISEEQRHQIESLCDSAEMMLNWCVKNVDKWNFSQYDYLHRDVEKTRALLNKKTEV